LTHGVVLRCGLISALVVVFWITTGVRKTKQNLFKAVIDQDERKTAAS